MKKVTVFILVTSILLSCVPALADNGIKILIDGDEKTFDVMPVMERDRTLVPMRGIFESLGAEVGWDDATRTASAKKDSITVEIQIGNSKVKVNGEEKELDVPAKLINGRTMVPVRFVSESLGCTVDWADETQTVIIASKKLTEGQMLLDGKKVIMIGNSYLYYGNTVIGKGRTAYSQEERNNDRGYFYQLCKANNIDVSVTNWTFSNHTLSNTFNGPCDTKIECAGVDHEAELTDKHFDYVVVSPHAYGSEESDFAQNFEYIMEFFKKYNPNVKFVVLGNHAIYGCGTGRPKFSGISDYYEILKEKGVIVADWGKLVCDIIEGKTKVPGAKQKYSVSSFIIKDSNHQNVLCGYLTALALYCGITGESAIGQPYEFYKDSSINAEFDMVKYKERRYGDVETNFTEIFESPEDMKGLQKLIDWMFF